MERLVEAHSGLWLHKATLRMTLELHGLSQLLTLNKKKKRWLKDWISHTGFSSPECTDKQTLFFTSELYYLSALPYCSSWSVCLRGCRDFDWVDDFGRIPVILHLFLRRVLRYCPTFRLLFFACRVKKGPPTFYSKVEPDRCCDTPLAHSTFRFIHNVDITWLCLVWLRQHLGACS